MKKVTVVKPAGKGSNQKKIAKAKKVSPTKRSVSMAKLDGGYVPSKKPSNDKKISKAKVVKPTKRGVFVGGKISKKK